jgi:MFS family permease
MLAWVVRYVCFAFGDVSTMPLVSLLYVGILLHGICYDFFFVTGQIYVNRVAPKAVQASAQGFIALVTYGVGMFIGANIAGWVVDQFAYQVVIDGVPQLTEKGDPLLHHYWQQIWLIPAVMAFVVLALFAIFFREKLSAADVAEPAA